MNISTEPWIPTVLVDGSPARVSLREVFERGHEIRDLSVRPHERVALMRLLLCVAQAALDGPDDYDDWRDCRDRIRTAGPTYLELWKQAFDLFTNEQPFLQTKDLEKPLTKRGANDDEKSASKLDIVLASGNNATLFDNSGGSQRSFGASELALMLVTFQCFSACGTIGVALWYGKPTIGWNSYPTVRPGQSAHAPCLSGNMLHAYVRGRDLLDTLCSNIITKEQAGRIYGPDSWGRPIWEFMPTDPMDKDAVHNATKTYLGRLIPLSRAVRLQNEGHSVVLANGLEYPAYPEWRDAAATIVTGTDSLKKEQSRRAISASLEKSLWRELHALTVIGAEKDGNGGPLALRNLPGDKDFDLWAGGLIAAGNGKLIDTVESVFHVPSAMLNEPSQKVYEEGVQLAERVGSRLRRAVSAYHKELGDNLDRSEMRTRRNRIQAKATSRFWTEIENAVPQLLVIAEQPSALGLKGQWGSTEWSKGIWRTARRAYEHACPNGTPRQMRAYSLGLKVLFTSPAVANEPESEVEVEA